MIHCIPNNLRLQFESTERCNCIGIMLSIQRFIKYKFKISLYMCAQMNKKTAAHVKQFFFLLRRIRTPIHNKILILFDQLPSYHSCLLLERLYLLLSSIIQNSIHFFFVFISLWVPIFFFSIIYNISCGCAKYFRGIYYIA